MFKKLLLVFFLVALIGGCKKYPEDPATIHLRTAKQRLTQRSFFTSSAVNFINGANYSGSQDNDYIYFNKNGDFNGEHSVYFNCNGKWKFEDKKNKLYIYNNTQSYSFQIIRLDAHFLSIKNDSVRCDYENTRP